MWREHDDESNEHEIRNHIETNSVQWNLRKVCALNCRRLVFPLFRACCPKFRPRKEQRLRYRSLNHVLTEVSITHIVKQLRVLSAAVRQTKTSKEWQELIHQECVLAYSDLDSSPSEQN